MAEQDKCIRDKGETMAKIIVNNENKKSTIAPEIYGHFSEHLGRCIYEGLFVGENSDIPNVNGMRTDVVDALKEMKIPVLRWPGGCFADEYHWMDGIGPKEKRKKIVYPIDSIHYSHQALKYVIHIALIWIHPAFWFSPSQKMHTGKYPCNLRKGV